MTPAKRQGPVLLFLWFVDFRSTYNPGNYPQVRRQPPFVVQENQGLEVTVYILLGRELEYNLSSRQHLRRCMRARAACCQCGAILERYIA